MEKNREVILGGGIAGLLLAYYNPEAILITDQIGGQFNAPFQLGPKYLHVDKYTNRLFSDLGIRPGIKNIKVGFFYKNELHERNTEENRVKYFQKTRGEGEVYKSTMSSDMTEFDSYDISTEELVEILKTKIKNEIIIGKVTNIDNLHRKLTLENGIVIPYSTLISTIPMNTFLFLNNKIEAAKQFKSFPTTFILVENNVVNDFRDYTYVYFSEPQYPFHRITQIEHGAVFEFKGDDIPRFQSEKNRFVQKTGQLIQNDIEISIKYVEFFGRYGCWKHGILVNDLLKQIYETKRDI
jgi:hypothetical protein